MISLAATFGDDEHTASVGPYERLMKIRKWLLILSAPALLLALNLLNEAAISDAVKFVSMPNWLVAQLVIGSMIYFILQYGIILIQLASTYDIILRERFAFRQAEDLKRAYEVAKDAQNSIMSHVEKMRVAATDRVKIATERSAYLQELVRNRENAIENSKSMYPDRNKDDLDRELESAYTLLHESHGDYVNALEEERHLLKSARPEYLLAEGRNDPVLTSLYERSNAAAAEIGKIQSMDKASRHLYRVSEMAIDFIRVMPIPILAIYALARLIFSSL